MGITWLAEVVSWQQGSCRFWIATDVINCLQGVLIFLMYICKKNDLKRVRDRWDGVVRHLKEEVRARNFWPTITRALSENETGSAGNTSNSSSDNKTKSTVVSLGSSQAKFSSEKSTSSVSTKPTEEDEQLPDASPSDNSTDAPRSEGEPPQAQDTSAPPAEDDGTERKAPEVQEGTDASDNTAPHEESTSGGTVNPPEVSIDMETHEDEEDEGSCAGLDVKYLNDGYDTDAKSSKDGASSENVGDTELKEINQNV
ncbi:dentin sialophosphoprotein-like [Macrobrachium rosenbergii]|uniref:dentin sialophosphoprotein-like n=1 Tax=Macrobrachium rosenbergii TaxID=79674 RepID=UPI0034D39524